MTEILTTPSNSPITAPAAIRGRLVGDRAAITAQTIARREWVAANAHHGPAAIAAALGLSRHTIRNHYQTLFAAPPVARIGMTCRWAVSRRAGRTSTRLSRRSMPTPCARGGEHEQP